MVAMSSPVTPRAYLVSRPTDTTPRTWPVDLPKEGLWKVTGDAGAGVSSFLVDTAVEAVARGRVLVIASSKESGARLRAELSERLAATGFVVDEPLVRSVHSLAFALLRQQTEKEIRLISGAEQDAMIRQLLAGNAQDGTGSWPEELRPALPMVGFARQLRDFLLRAVERGLGPDDLQRLGRDHNIPIWSASGEFLLEYQQVMRLTGALRYSASELVAEVLAGMRAGAITETWDAVIVDDAQHLAPASAELVSHLLQRATLGVVGGDGEQAVFRFRGASPRFFATMSGLDHQVIDLGATRRNPQRQVVIAPEEQTHHATLVDTIRRAHFEQGEPFSSMAVVVRSTPMIEPIRRSMLAAGVPVMLDPTDVVLAEQRIVVSLLLGLEALESELQATQWRDLLLGPVGGADPVTLRRLLRGLRRFAPEENAEAVLHRLLATDQELPDFDGVLTEREVAILTRMRSVLEAGREALAANGSVEEVLWALWAATGLADRLMAAALRGGATGSQADRDLDAAMALFDAAGDFTERRPTAGVASFIEYISQQELPTGVRDRRTAKPDAVHLVTAHGAAGREFGRVIVAGVHEHSWPSLGETGTMFRQEDLIDLLDAGVDPAVPVSHAAERLVEERRLFHVATTRATKHLLVTAVDDQDSDEVVTPSRFIEEFCTTFNVDAIEADPDTVQVLAKDEVIAQLRRVLTDPEGDALAREQAARQLARLDNAGVSGAGEGQWWGLRGASTSEALKHRTALSPSRIEKLLECPMREVLERMVGLDETMNMIHGSLAHAYFEALGRGMEATTARAAVMAAREAMQDGPAWKNERDLADFSRLLDRIDTWVVAAQARHELLAVEANVDVTVDVETGLRIRGRVDRLEADEGGLVRIVDLKSGANMPSQKETEDNKQLLAYQLALTQGELRGDEVRDARGDGMRIGSAVLVYPGSTTKAVGTREQSAKSPEELSEFAQLIRPLPEAMAGPILTATTGTGCEYCQVRSLCPVQPEGMVIADV